MIPIAKPVMGKEEMEAVVKVLQSGMLVQGKVTKEFESEFADYCGVKHAVLTSSGTTALHTCLACAGISKGDEVITSPFTFVATANSILMQGGNPVFADIKQDTFNIDPEAIKKKITENTKAILPIDLYGQIYDHKEVKEIADENGLIVIEDACQAVGAEVNNKKAGSFGDISAFSMYATKNLISGEGGIVTTDIDELAEKARRFINHGQGDRYDYIELGYNYRATDLQAAIALSQLKKIEELNEKRIQNAKRLSKGLIDVPGIQIPHIKEDSKHVYHQYTIKVDKHKLSRDELLIKLRNNGVGANIYYPKCLHLTKVYSGFGHKEGDFPVSERLAKQVLSLPVHPGVSKEDVQKIVGTIRN